MAGKKSTSKQFSKPLVKRTPSHVERANLRIKEYNAVCRFVSKDADASREVDRRMDSRLTELEKMMSQDAAKYEGILAELHDSVAEMKRLVDNDPYWYTQQNILADGTEGLSKLIPDLVKVPDVGHFANYARDITFSMELAPRPTANCEVRTTCTLVGVILRTHDSSSVLHAFHLAVSFLAKLGAGDRFLGRRGNTRRLLTCIEACLSRSMQTLSDWPRLYVFKFPLQSPDYLDCAAARRELWAAMEGCACKGSEQEANPNADTACVVPRGLDLLEKMQRQALREIWGNVILAVGRHLPMDLVRSVFDAAVDCEEVPLEWRVRYRETDQLREAYTCICHEVPGPDGERPIIHHATHGKA